MTPELFQAILDEMSEGTSLRQACRMHDAHKSTFLRIVDGDKELGDRYAGARARMLDAQAEALEEIGDQAAGAETAVEVAGLRLKSDNRKWLLSKLAPKKYGDKLDLNHGGGVEYTRVVRQVVDPKAGE